MIIATIYGYYKNGNGERNFEMMQLTFDNYLSDLDKLEAHRKFCKFWVENSLAGIEFISFNVKIREVGFMDDEIGVLEEGFENNADKYNAFNNILEKYSIRKNSTFDACKKCDKYLVCKGYSIKHEAYHDITVCNTTHDEIHRFNVGD